MTTTQLTKNAQLLAWIEESAKLTKPAKIVWCDGSDEEHKRLLEVALTEGAVAPLNQEKLPGCYYSRSHPNDVARVEHLTFICTPTKDEAGPTNNWLAPDDAYAKMRGLLSGGMTGRTMYVIPYVMGPVGSPMSKVGIELTDSVYVVLNMRIMTRMGKVALDMLADSNDFNRGLHAMLDLNPERRMICHFPQHNTIWSLGSGYGGNVLLGKKCLALRIGSYLGKKEGWLAEHMLILGLESPEGEIHYVAAAFPSACGKTNLAMLIPPEHYTGWKVTTVGDDIAWMRVGDDGRLWAINPEAGYFGVAPGTSEKSNPNAMRTVARDTLFTNVALTPDRDVWWEGKDGDVPPKLTDWQGNAWVRGESKGKAAHPNSRFTSPAGNNPALSSKWDDPAGVPISAIIFGGRRASTVPLVMESFNWTHGVYFGATMGSETTAAATGEVGVVRRDPMAMLPFCGYNVGEYFAHWLHMQTRIPNPPRIFMVNWFRQQDGKFLWPGFGDNMRVLKWMIDRVEGRVAARETLVGWLPREGDLDTTGLDAAPGVLEAAMNVDLGEWKQELESQAVWFDQIGETLPKALRLQREMLLERVTHWLHA